MQKKLTITIDKKVYQELKQGYLAISQDGECESEAREWAGREHDWRFTAMKWGEVW